MKWQSHSLSLSSKKGMPLITESYLYNSVTY